MRYVVDIVEVSEDVLAVVRATTRLQDVKLIYRGLFDQVYAFLKTSPLQRGFNVIVYFDAVAHIAAGVQVSGPFARSGNVECYTRPAGRAVHTLHVGPYSALGGAHAAIHQYIRETGAKLGLSWEVYGHWHDDPTQLQTDVYYMLENG